LALPLMFACLAGCADSRDTKTGGRQAQDKDRSALSRKLSSLSSASYHLAIDDLDKFRPGRPKDDILKDVKWRGDFVMAAEYNGQAVSAIVYELFPDRPDDKGGVWLWAIFEGDKFTKFVELPPTLPDDREVVGHSEHGAPFLRPKPLKTGDDRFLIRGVNGNALSIEQLKDKVKSLAPVPKQIDPGLTAAYLLMRATGAMPNPAAPASDEDYLKNAGLRDQFNAARLKLGMAPAEVEAALKSKPLESGEVEAGQYKIYGSNQSFNIADWLHFSNVLVIFREGKAVIISSNIPSGHDWRQKLGKMSSDLPNPKQ
jgi:hypothetical protein